MSESGYVPTPFGTSYSIILVLFILLAIIGCVCYSGFGC